MDLPRFFNARDLGASLEEVATQDISAASGKLFSRWFHSAKDADLFIWFDGDRNVLKQQLSFYGQVVEWNVLEGVKTGHILIDETKPSRKGSEIVRFDSKAQKSSIDQAVKVLSFVKNLNDSEKELLSGNFTTTSIAKSLSAEEFVARFGKFLDAPPDFKPRPRGFWNRLRAFFTKSPKPSRDF